MVFTKDHYRTHTPYKRRVVLRSSAGHIHKSGPDLGYRKHCGSREERLREPTAQGVCWGAASPRNVGCWSVGGARAWESHD